MNTGTTQARVRQPLKQKLYSRAIGLILYFSICVFPMQMEFIYSNISNRFHLNPPANATERQRLFATLNNQQITSADIEDSLQSVISSVQETMYELRRRDLNRKINDVLLTQEAQKRQVTTRALLDAEVYSKAPSFTDAEAQKFYETNKDKMNVAFADVKPQILRYLQNAEKDKLQLTFAANLRKAAAIEDFLPAPEKVATKGTK